MMSINILPKPSSNNEFIFLFKIMHVFFFLLPLTIVKCFVLTSGAFVRGMVSLILVKKNISIVSTFIVYIEDRYRCHKSVDYLFFN